MASPYFAYKSHVNPSKPRARIRKDVDLLQEQGD